MLVTVTHVCDDFRREMLFSSFNNVFLTIISMFYGDFPLATTPLGWIVGSQLNVNGRQVLSFRGVPFAEPPIGQLRFKDPVPISPRLVFDATKEGPACIQYSFEFSPYLEVSEDCLRLNIYTHNLKQEKDQLRDVMVWIHGGSFAVGSGGSEEYGPEYLLDRDIVLVTINYRLGPCGFLSTEDEEAPGNYGLLDQSLALKWVKQNIIYFGGNSDSITIFGESAGGASVHLHMLSPHSNGLINRAIAQSGTALCRWVISDSAGEYTRKAAEFLNCSTTSSRDILECLRLKSVNEIVSTSTFYGVFAAGFSPRLDVERQSPFMPKHPEIMIRQRLFNPIPFITGVAKNEGSNILSYLFWFPNEMDAFQQNRINFTRRVFNMEFSANGQDIARNVLDHYLAKNKSLTDELSAMEQMFADGALVACTDKTVRLQSQFSSQPVYYYYYTHNGEHSSVYVDASPYMVRHGIQWNTSFVSHGDDLYLLFSNRGYPINTNEDMAVSKLLVDLWTSFAATGDPGSGLGWMPVGEQMSYLKIRTDPVVIKGNMPFYDRMALWDEYLSVSDDQSSDQV